MKLFSYWFYAAMVICCFSCGGDKKKETTSNENANDQMAPATVFVNGIIDANKGDVLGNVHLTFKADFQNSSGKLVVYESECKFTHPIDSAEFKNGICEFPSLNCGQGVYWVSYKNSENKSSFILNPKESNVTINIRSEELDGALYSGDSKENQAWTKYYLQESIIQKKILEKKRARAKSNKKDQYDKLIAWDDAELNQLQIKTINEFPGTFVSKLLTWKQEPDKKDKLHYWDNIDFTDYSLIRSKVMHDREQSFFQLFGGAKEEGYMECIDIIVERAKVNPQVLEPILYSLLEGFSQTKFDGVSAYLLDHYIYGDGCGAEMSAAIQTRSQGIRNVQVGQVPPNIKMALYNGGTSDLYKLAEKNKYTMVLFWSSWCEKCAEETPAILSTYAQYKPKGFEILGVSVDKDKDMWTNAIVRKGFTFPNVCGMKEWDSQVAKDYYVVKTPVMILLDSNKKIVFRTTGGMAEVTQFLQSKLGA